MRNRQVQTEGQWWIATARGRTCFVAWAKRGRIVAHDPIREPGDDVYFEFGDTREEALAAMRRDLGLLPHNAAGNAPGGRAATDRSR